ncbi:hypothetical protein [Microbacterium tumbae]
MHPASSTRVPVVAAILVAVGALLSSFAVYQSMLLGIPSTPRAYFLNDPIGWGFVPGFGGFPLAVLGMLLALVLLTAGTWIFVRLVVRSSAPGRGAAVFFGTWGAVIVAAWIAGIARAPLVMARLQIPADMPDVYGMQFNQVVTAGAGWALTWGWLTALVALIVHRATPGFRQPTADGAAPVAGYPVPPAPSPGMAAFPTQHPYGAAPQTPPYQAQPSYPPLGGPQASWYPPSDPQPPTHQAADPQQPGPAQPGPQQPGTGRPGA